MQQVSVDQGQLLDENGRVLSIVGGGATAGASVVRKFPFAFNTAHLSDGTGAALYTPTVGDLLLDAWIQPVTAWDGTTPRGDFGLFTGINGLQRQINGDSFSTTDMRSVPQTIDGLGQAVRHTYAAQVAMYDLSFNGTVSGSSITIGQLGNAFLPARFVTSAPIKVCVSQDGSLTGGDPASTQGAATLYLVTATPA